MSDIVKVKVEANDDVFGDILKIAIENAPEPEAYVKGETVDQIEFVWVGDIYGSQDCSMTVWNNKSALEQVKKNWTHNRSVKAKARVNRLSYDVIQKTDDPVEMSIRCTGSCAATLAMIDRWLERWRGMLQGDCADRDAVVEYVKTHEVLKQKIERLVKYADSLILQHAIVSKKGELTVLSNTVNQTCATTPGLTYALDEAKSRKLAEFHTRKVDIRKLTAAFDGDRTDEVYATFATGIDAYRRYCQHRERDWLRRVVDAYATALGDTSGKDRMDEIEERERLLTEQRKQKQREKAQERKRSNAAKALLAQDNVKKS